MKNKRKFIFFKKKPRFVIAARPDGLGIRLCALINASYIASKLGYDFGFMWDVKEEDTFKNSLKFIQVDCNEANKSNSCIDINIGRVGWGGVDTNRVWTGIDIPEASDIFSIDFIDSNMLKNNYINAGYGYGMLNGMYKSIYDLKKYKPENWWGWYSNAECLYDVFEDCNKDEIRAYFCNYYKNMHFSDKYNSIIKQVYFEANKINKEFLSIHIRSGDIIYGDWRNRAICVYDRSVAYELVMDIIYNNKDETIVIFGEDLNANYELVRYFKDYSIINIDDIVKKYNYNVSERAFFEINFISLSKIIYRTTKSAFSRFSHLISLNNEEVLIDKIYTHDRQYEIICNNFNKLNISKYQKAMSCFRLYVLSKKCNLDCKIYLKHLTSALCYDADNDAYRIHFVSELINCGFLEEANTFLKDVISYRFDSYMKTLLDRNRSTYSYEINQYINFDSNLFDNINIIKARLFY